jgi:hypothetical protein
MMSTSRARRFRSKSGAKVWSSSMNHTHSPSASRRISLRASAIFNDILTMSLVRGGIAAASIVSQNREYRPCSVVRIPMVPTCVTEGDPWG